LKALIENYFKPFITSLKISLQACLQKKSFTKCFAKLSLPKNCLKSIFQKLSYKDLSLILKKGIIQNPNSICFMQIKTLGHCIWFLLKVVLIKKTCLLLFSMTILNFRKFLKVV
jgi:hypothetical protein